MRGWIKFYNGSYGFIQVKDSEVDYFVHHSEIGDKTWIPQSGDTVEFEPRDTERGWKAVEVKKVDYVDTKYTEN